MVAQQITTIQKAQQARLDRFLFEGSEIVLKDSCAVFITMNPGKGLVNSYLCYKGGKCSEGFKL